MRPINQPLVHTADESFAEFERRRWGVRAAARPARAGSDKGTPGDAAMYAQNGQAPELSCPLKRRRSEDGERSKRARAAAERGCESDGGLPSSDQHKKTVRPPPADQGPSPGGDLHGVCTLEEGSLKLKISLHRPHVTPDGDGAGKYDGPVALAKAEARGALQPSSCSAVPRGEGQSEASDAGLSTAGGSAPAPVVVPTRDTLCSASSCPLPNSAATQADAGSPQPPPGNHNTTDTAPTSLDLDIPKTAPYEPRYDRAQDTATAASLAPPTHYQDSASGARTRKSTTPGHYVPYEAPQSRRRLIQDTSKLRRKGRGPAMADSAKAPPHSSFHHVHMSVGQNGGRGFVNHNSIMDHPSVHARMFPPPESPPTKLAALLNSTRPAATSAAGNQRPSKAGTSSAEHQPLDLSRAMPKRGGPAPKLSCLDQMPGNYVPPIAVFYMRPGSRQRLDGIIRKLWAKHNSSLLRGRPRP